MSNTEAQTTVAAEQAADLAALQAAAMGGAQAGPVATVEAEAQAQELKPPSPAAMQIAGLVVGMGRPILVYAVPALKDAPDELWAPIPEGVGAVLDHYGASAGWMQSPWARLAVSVAPLVAFAAVSAMNKPAPAEAAGETAPQALEKWEQAQASSKAVQFGTVQHDPGAAS